MLAEVRKRAESEGLDRLSQDMFKAVHNVQGRLLAEHVSQALLQENAHMLRPITGLMIIFHT